MPDQNETLTQLKLVWVEKKDLQKKFESKE